MFDYSTRILMAVILLCMVTLLPTLRSVMYLGFRFQSVLSTNDEVTVYQKRLHLLREALPRHGVVGYVGNRGKEYRLTQYTLAPLLVDYTPNHPFVIGNFPGAVPDRGCNDKNLILVFDFGDGVCLFRTVMKQ
jgi:hypothetical protein